MGTVTGLKDKYTCYLLLVLPLFLSISSTKIRNNTLEVSFGIPGVRTEPENYLRVKPIVDKKIDFMLEFESYSSG